jgi:D-amino peptidase
MPKVYVLMDIEGVAGLVHSEEGARGNPEYERARRLMTDEASAIVDGVFAADGSSEVTVVDSHGSYRNIIPELLDSRATLLRGKPRYAGMMDSIDEGYNFAMFAGVHGQGGQGESVMSHTFTGHLLDIRVNGASHGELGLNAMIAGAYGVRVALVAGDQHVVESATSLLGEKVHTIRTKTSRGASAAETLHPSTCCQLLREGAQKATLAWRDAPTVSIGGPVTIEVEFDRPVYADLAMLIDGSGRQSGRVVEFQRPTYPDAYRLMRLLTVLSTSPV